MVSKTIIGIIILSLLVLMYGCAQQEVNEMAVPEAAAVPAALQNAGMSEPGIQISSIPKALKENERTIISWDLTGGPATTNFTAVYYDFSSHAGTLSKEDGPDKAKYPYSTKEYVIGGYPVPGTYSTIFDVPANAKGVFVRAYADMDGKHFWTEEQTIGIVVPSIAFISIPESIYSDQAASVTWKVNSERRMISNDNTLYYDTSSHASIPKIGTSPQTAGYAYSAKEHSTMEYVVPHLFSSSLSAPAGAERIYVRAYSKIEGKHYWTDEKAIARSTGISPAEAEVLSMVEITQENIEPSAQVQILTAPNTVKQDEKISIFWMIDSMDYTSADATSIQYDSESRQGLFKADMTPSLAGYRYMTEEETLVSIPGSFTATFAIPADARVVYLRAYALIGGKNYWSRELKVGVTKPSLVLGPVDSEYKVKADAKGVSPDRLWIRYGDHARIIFDVMDDAPAAGLEFRSELWESTGVVKPGQMAAVEFNASVSFEFGSYYAGTGTLYKKVLVIVQ